MWTAAGETIWYRHAPCWAGRLLSRGPPQLHHTIHHAVPATAAAAAWWPSNRSRPCRPAAVATVQRGGRMRRRLPSAATSWMAGWLWLHTLLLLLLPTWLQRHALLLLLVRLRLRLRLRLLRLLPNLHGASCRLLQWRLLRGSAGLLRCCCHWMLNMPSTLWCCAWLLTPPRRLSRQGSCLRRANDGPVPSCHACQAGGRQL